MSARGSLHATGERRPFSAAGADGMFHPAAATISGDAIVVTSAEVKEPKEVRFAFDETADPNFGNRDGLPAAPFRSDEFPIPSQ
jgi:sialate O-acetylesterase